MQANGIKHVMSSLPSVNKWTCRKECSNVEAWNQADEGIKKTFITADLLTLTFIFMPEQGVALDSPAFVALMSGAF